LALPLIALQYHEVRINLEFNDLRNMCLGREIQRSWNPDVVRQALVAAAGFHPQVLLDSFIAINCCPFDDPNRDRSMSNHSGHHADILRFLDARSDCRKVMHRLYARFENMRRNEVSDIYVAFVCRSGKHRSVGMATALRLAIGDDACYNLRSVVYCTDLARACRCGLCHACDTTHLRTRARVEATHNLRACWPQRSFQ
jgi:RNase adaptor protein for sRNA GlmZ degradation